MQKSKYNEEHLHRIISVHGDEFFWDWIWSVQVFKDKEIKTKLFNISSEQQKEAFKYFSGHVNQLNKNIHLSQYREIA